MHESKLLPTAYCIFRTDLPELKTLYEKSIVPAVSANGLNVRHLEESPSEPSLDSSLRQIRESSIIIVDLTKASSRAYLELGCAVGLGKTESIILTVSKNYDGVATEPFSTLGTLGQLGVIRWSISEPDHFRAQLDRRIRQDLPKLAVAESDRSNWDEEWITRHRSVALKGLKDIHRSGFMEACFRVAEFVVKRGQRELLKAAEEATIHAFGWPIGIVLHTDKDRPRPTADGIVAEVKGSSDSYDYWALRTNGDYYFFGSLFEDERADKAIWADTRIVRVTETLVFCYRLYKNLGVPDESFVRIRIRHGGLRGRSLSSARAAFWGPNRTSQEEAVEWETVLQLLDLKSRLHEIVAEALDPLFVLFDFFKPGQETLYAYIDTFLQEAVREQPQLFG